MKYYIHTIIIIMILLHSAYAESDIEKYKNNYSAQLIPLLKERMGSELEMQSEADAHEHVSILANKMASCQLIAIEDYPQKYQDASINPIVNGISLKKANDDLNSIIQTDIKNGNITDQELMTITQAAIEKYKVCLSESDLNLGNPPE